MHFLFTRNHDWVVALNYNPIPSLIHNFWIACQTNLGRVQGQTTYLSLLPQFSHRQDTTYLIIPWKFVMYATHISWQNLVNMSILKKLGIYVVFMEIKEICCFKKRVKMLFVRRVFISIETRFQWYIFENPWP